MVEEPWISVYIACKTNCIVTTVFVNDLEFV